MFTLNLNLSQYPALHNLIKTWKIKITFLLHSTKNNENKNKLYITFSGEDISSGGFEIENIAKDSDSATQEYFNHTLI